MAMYVNVGASFDGSVDRVIFRGPTLNVRRN